MKHTSLRLSKTGAGLLLLLLVFETDCAEYIVKSRKSMEEREGGWQIIFSGRRKVEVAVEAGLLMQGRVLIPAQVV